MNLVMPTRPTYGKRCYSIEYKLNSLYCILIHLTGYFSIVMQITKLQNLHLFFSIYQ